MWGEKVGGWNINCVVFFIIQHSGWAWNELFVFNSKLIRNTKGLKTHSNKNCYWHALVPFFWWWMECIKENFWVFFVKSLSIKSILKNVVWKRLHYTLDGPQAPYDLCLGADSYWTFMWCRKILLLFFWFLIIYDCFQSWTVTFHIIPTLHECSISLSLRFPLRKVQSVQLALKWEKKKVTALK